MKTETFNHERWSVQYLWVILRPVLVDENAGKRYVKLSYIYGQVNDH